MDQNKLTDYKRRLMKEKDRIQRTIDVLNENNTGISQRDTSDDLSIIDNHPGDIATEMFDKERDFALISNEKHLLTEVEKALNKIENGSYGKCEACGKDISFERLDFLPSSITCIECEKNAVNYKTYIYDRPIEEEAIGSFGKYFMDNPNDEKEEVGFNAEDSWQEVEKLNEYKGHKRIYDKPSSDKSLSMQNEGQDEEEDEEDSGYVEFTDKISNQYYKQQLP